MNLLFSNTLRTLKSSTGFRKYGLRGRLLITGALVSFSLFLNLPQTGYSETYTWKDKNGRTHFGDAPPDKSSGMDVKAIEIKEANPPVIDAEVLKRRAKQYKLLEAYHEESLEQKEIDIKKKKREKRNKAACARAKDNLRRYEGRVVFYRLNEDGSRSYMSEEEKIKKLNKLRKGIKKNCK